MKSIQYELFYLLYVNMQILKSVGSDKPLYYNVIYAD